MDIRKTFGHLVSKFVLLDPVLEVRQGEGSGAVLDDSRATAIMAQNGPSFYHLHL